MYISVDLSRKSLTHIYGKTQRKLLKNKCMKKQLQMDQKNISENKSRRSNPSLSKIGEFCFYFFSIPHGLKNIDCHFRAFIVSFFKVQVSIQHEKKNCCVHP